MNRVPIHTPSAPRASGRGEAAPVEDAARGDDRDLLADGVDDLGNERHRGDRAGMATGLGALGDDEVAPAGDGGDGVADLAAHRGDDDPGVVQRVDDVAGDPETGDEQRGTAVDDVADPRLDLVRDGGEQVDAERLGGG